MDKGARVDGIDSNVRPYSIFFGYMGCCLGVTVFIIVKMFEKVETLYASAPSRLPAKRHIILFTTLVVLSLLSTWGFMFQYFQWSYNNWLAVRSQHGLDPSAKHWGLWLKETSLFKEAWLSVVIGRYRYWWSHQIFYFAACLGLHLEWKGACMYDISVANTDRSRRSPRSNVHMGLHAPWPDCSSQLRYKPVLPNLASESAPAAQRKPHLCTVYSEDTGTRDT